ncbi:Nmad5 family putative nucleotide modification protein [Treponema pedis]|uniref:Nmad5 family putative nucleotide modification protein n=1 Tax=Treponema pedis TaxID=409322 RepID=UPI003D25FAB4
MKLTQGIRDKIIESYCKEKYHTAISTLNKEFKKAVTDAVKKLFADFDFEKAKEFEQYIAFYEEVYINSFYGERQKLEELYSSLFFKNADSWYCIRINTKYPSKHPLYFDDVNKETKALVKSHIENITNVLEKFIEEKETINAVLLSCSTDKQLSDTLPEIMPYFPKETQTTVQLVSLETLNRAKTLLSVKKNYNDEPF